MVEKERVYGEKILTLLDNLQRDGIILTLHLLGQEYERMTIITDIVTRNGSPYFILDYPKGFRGRIRDSAGGRLYFEFVGRDHIHYSFKASLKKVLENDIWIKLPDYIEKIQRRTHFRLEPPIGTTIYLIKNTRRYEISVRNISEGGALITERKASLKKPNFYVNEDIGEVQLLCQDKVLKFKAKITNAQIKRVIKDPTTGRYTYALHFDEIGQREKNALGDWIFKCQREYLRKRV